MQCSICKDSSQSTYLAVENTNLCNNCYVSSYSCIYCKQLITTSFIPILDKKLHPECYQRASLNKCDQCQQVILTQEFILIGQKKFCKNCSSNVITCAGCGHPILDAYIPIGNLKFHTTCYQQSVAKCSNCKIPFGDSEYFAIEGQNLCKNCWTNLYSCAGCGQLIQGEYIPDGNKKYHTNCKQLPICSGCRLTIIGNCLLINGAYWHAECDQKFRQQSTIDRITGRSSISNEVKICGRCQNQIIGEMVFVNNKPYHPECFNTTQRGHHNLGPVGYSTNRYK
eukprot:TRINITY_DN3546_c0_g2_i1.p1 TRINITY_DN3546_c0_g2~~TRINITY_DN3546_c0_g2_i1.p1  ORF type:complete len:298 (-),score=106.29 TRINITY_DN3546_c0_g2_i1:50-895(-)